jgi:hypothetical protein
LLRTRDKRLYRLGARIDRSRVDKDESAWKRGISRREFDGHHSAQAVADDDRFLDLHRLAEGGKVVCEVPDLVAMLRPVALAASAHVEGRDPVRPGEVVELGLKGRVVAAPAGDEKQLRLAAPRPLVVQPQA